MIDYLVNSSRAQIKIQQMAFVLVAIVIFFGMVALLYFSISLGSLKKGAQNLQDEEASEIVRKISSSAEFAFTSKDCPNCLDADKVLILKSKPSYNEFWDLDFLQIEKVYPLGKKVECQKSNYPDCNTITLVGKEQFGSPSSAFVSLCRFEQSKGGFTKCELGRIHASGKDLSEK
jgi:hypothetical protein